MNILPASPQGAAPDSRSGASRADDRSPSDFDALLPRDDARPSERRARNDERDTTREAPREDARDTSRERPQDASREPVRNDDSVETRETPREHAQDAPADRGDASDRPTDQAARETQDGVEEAASDAAPQDAGRSDPAASQDAQAAPDAAPNFTTALAETIAAQPAAAASPNAQAAPATPATPSSASAPASTPAAQLAQAAALATPATSAQPAAAPNAAPNAGQTPTQAPVPATDPSAGPAQPATPPAPSTPGGPTSTVQNTEAQAAQLTHAPSLRAQGEQPSARASERGQSPAHAQSARAASPAAQASPADQAQTSAPKPAAPTAPTNQPDPAALAAERASAPTPDAARLGEPADPARLAGGDPTLDTLETADVRRAEHAQAARAPERAATTTRAQAFDIAAFASRFARRAADGATRFEIRLDPPELGRVDVRLEVSAEGAAHARLLAERPEALAELARHARALERELAEAGVSLEQGGLSFELADQGANARDHAGDESETFGAPPTEDRTPSEAEMVPDALAEIDTSYGYSVLHRGRLDVRV